MRLGQKKKIPTSKTWLMILIKYTLLSAEHLRLLCDCIGLLILFLNDIIMQSILHITFTDTLLRIIFRWLILIRYFYFVWIPLLVSLRVQSIACFILQSLKVNRFVLVSEVILFVKSSVLGRRRSIYSWVANVEFLFCVGFGRHWRLSNVVRFSDRSLSVGYVSIYLEFFHIC